MDISEDELDQLLERNLDACGKAFGFVLAMAMQEPTPLTPASLKTFAGHLHSLDGEERFSHHVAFVVGGVVAGMAAALNAKRLTDGEDPFAPAQLC